MEKHNHQQKGFFIDCPKCCSLLFSGAEEIKHSHTEPNIGGMFDCLACDAIDANLMPSEDGFFMFEFEDRNFCRVYYRIWEEHEKAGILKTFFVNGFELIDNRLILQQVRTEVKLRNPNGFMNKTD